MGDPGAVQAVDQALGRQQGGLDAPRHGRRRCRSADTFRPGSRRTRRARPGAIRRKPPRSRRRTRGLRGQVGEQSVASGFKRKAELVVEPGRIEFRGPGDIQPAALQAAQVEQHADPTTAAGTCSSARATPSPRRHHRRTSRCGPWRQCSPGSIVRPPRLGKHQGVRVTSISLAGSQTPRERPMRGMGRPQRQMGEDGLGRSGAPVALPMVSGPMEIGNRHSQQTSEIGLTKRPVQDCAEAAARPQQGHQRERGR